MKAMILGAGGQVGRALRAMAPSGTALSAFERTMLDVGDRPSLVKAVAAIRPDVIFNAAAYTAVDKAESEPALAQRLNEDAPGWLAQAAAENGAHLVHLSTDFVFDGASGLAYQPDAPAKPLNVYGRSKWNGEQRVRKILPEALIVRTSWVYAANGRNFALTMLRLMQGEASVRVVADQVGTPTYAIGLAGALWAFAHRRAGGTYHYTDSGVASWYDFAVAIREEALALRLLQDSPPVVPIGTADYPTPARRPPFSVLDKTTTWALLGAPARHWREQLRLMMNEVKDRG
jgi:dTDP-4-dehydrorhamnose reductase